jgi:hypothetical protein
MDCDAKLPSLARLNPGFESKNNKKPISNKLLESYYLSFSSSLSITPILKIHLKHW